MDAATRNAIVLKHRALPYYVVRKMGRYHPSILALGEEDAAQIGYIGLLRAAEIFDPSLGFAFSTYATRAIWQRIHQAAAVAGLVHVPSYMAGDKGPEKHQEAAQRARRCQPLLLEDEPAAPPAFDADAAREEAAALRKALAAARKRLTAQERRVIRIRFDDGQTLAAAGEKLHLSKERIRQIQNRALEKMKKSAILAAFAT